MADPQSRSQRLRAQGIAALVRAGGAPFPCQLKELSAGGAFLRTPHFMAPGTVLEVDLIKGGSGKLRLRAVVLREIPGNEGGLDVEFRPVRPPDLQRLVSWLDEMRARPSAALPTTGMDMAPATSPIHTSPIPTAPIGEDSEQEHAPIGEDAEEERSTLVLQIEELFREMDELRDRLRKRELEVQDLRRQLTTAEQLLGSRRVRK